MNPTHERDNGTVHNMTAVVGTLWQFPPSDSTRPALSFDTFIRPARPSFAAGSVSKPNSMSEERY